MTESLQTQMENLRLSIAGLEAQRSTLGDKIVDPAVAALRQQLDLLEKQLAAQAAPVEERRMVTILFFDLVGSTSLAEKLDPEEWRQILSRVHAALGETVAAHHGMVAQYLGDGLLAFFGSQQASEHDPENGIRAALDGHAAVANLELAHKVQLRAGIHTGLVVVGELGNAIHKEFTASGDAMNLAARLQSSAPQGGTLISHDTYSYVRGVFNLTPQPSLAVKGRSEPLQTYLVRSAKPRPFRSVTRGVAGIETRTIGREQELQTLKQAYLQAYEGRHVVWAQLLGEPGVGKSRLLVDMMDWLDLRDETSRLLRARAVPDDVSQPFALVRRLWFDRFQIAEDAPLINAEAKWVERFKELSGMDESEEPAHALGLLVGLPFENSPYIKGMRNDPTQVKGRALVVSRELFSMVRQQDPVVILLEDMQWVDAASWDYLMDVFLSPSTTEQPNGLFILGAARLEWQPPQPLLDLLASPSTSEKRNDLRGVQISLAPLNHQSARELVMELFQRAVDVPEQVIDLLVQRSEGVPYFMEEMVNWFIDHDILDTQVEPWRFLPERLKAQPLPATLQHLLQTRLSSLSQSERAALQHGSIFGRRFWTGGVEAMGIPSGEETLVHLLPRGFVDVQPESAFEGDTEWSFHHNLLQEVTYESVLKRERAALHKIAAGWLEQQARHAGRLDEFAGLLGDHYERAGELTAAADWYLLAGSRAYSQGAPRESRDYFSKALDLLPPVDRDRRWQALLGHEAAVSVMADAEAWKADINALLDLAHTLADDNLLAEAYLRQTIYGMRAGDERVCDQAASEALAAARRVGNEAIEIKALALMGIRDINRGDKSALIDHTDEALRSARRLGDENVLSFTLFRAAYCYTELDFARAEALYIEQTELDHRLGNRIQEAQGMGNLAAIYMEMGLYKQARGLLEKAIHLSQALGAHRILAYQLGGLTNIYRVAGDLRKARQVVEQAMQEIYPTHDYIGILVGLIGFGQILLEIGDIPGALKRLNEAQDLAMQQGYSDLSYRAKAVLAACAIMQGQLEEARGYAHESWDYLKEHGYFGMNEPVDMSLSCAETFEALGEVENAQDVIKTAHKEIMKLAETITVPAWRQSFFENVPEHRKIIEMWERLQH